MKERSEHLTHQYTARISNSLWCLSLPSLVSAKIARNKTERIIKLRLEFSYNIDAIEIGRRMNVIAGIAVFKSPFNPGPRSCHWRTRRHRMLYQQQRAGPGILIEVQKRSSRLLEKSIHSEIAALSG
jgi:hypothetical protein